ncbi:MAG: phosphoribosyl-AMP cyclohydrolase [Candidatus Omnitrophica bacterium]|nr:phosphoribosyl-AMP cyclohydrolase [Candidatus Omnitrophota bacterium]
MNSIDDLKFDSQGLIPVVIQDAENKDVLMVAYMNKMSLEKTLETGLATYWSRSRKELWLKGETSGHYQKVEKIHFDCDKDTLLIQVTQLGVACHTGERSCFFTRMA